MCLKIMLGGLCAIDETSLVLTWSLLNLGDGYIIAYQMILMILCLKTAKFKSRYPKGPDWTRGRGCRWYTVFLLRVYLCLYSCVFGYRQAVSRWLRSGEGRREEENVLGSMNGVDRSFRTRIHSKNPP